MTLYGQTGWWSTSAAPSRTELLDEYTCVWKYVWWHVVAVWIAECVLFRNGLWLWYWYSSLRTARTVAAGVTTLTEDSIFPAKNLCAALNQKMDKALRVLSLTPDGRWRIWRAKSSFRRVSMSPPISSSWRWISSSYTSRFESPWLFWEKCLKARRGAQFDPLVSKCQKKVVHNYS